MAASRNLADVLRAVADRVERGESFPNALREVASELEGTPDWHLAAIDAALADEDDIEQSWDVALADLRDDLVRP